MLQESGFSAKDQGIGINNVITRLEKIYGDQYEFKIFNHESEQGVNVSISIPIALKLQLL